MYQVIFSDYDLKASVVVLEAPVVEPAVQFALELHRASSVPHIVQVFHIDDSETIVTFTLEPARDGK